MCLNVFSPHLSNNWENKRDGLPAPRMPTFLIMLQSILYKKKFYQLNWSQHDESSMRAQKLSLVMKKSAFCIRKSKDVDRLRGNPRSRSAPMILCTDSTIFLLPLILNFKHLAIFSDCTARFVSENLKDRFSHDAAQLYISLTTLSPNITKT